MPKKAIYSDDVLRMAATLYHVDNLGQAEVADFVQVSQTKISRLLAIARERGIVRISVEQYAARNERMEEKLRTTFALKDAAVIKVPAGVERQIARQYMGHFGAPFVASLLPSGGVVALGGGRSVASVVRRFRRGDLKRLTWVQAMGSIDANISPDDAIELGRFIVSLWGGEFLRLNTPALVPDKRTRDSFLASDQIKAVWQRLHRADAAIVGVGPIENSTYLERRVLQEDAFARLRDAGAVGEICGRFFDAKGRECQSPLRNRIISVELQELHRIRCVVGVGAEPERAAAIAAALRGGLLNALLVNETAAEALLGLA
ncbi:MAG: transcriptional regulator [Opitutaceae bacterium]|nr:transcriptional regulator [Opitutaceae bacterium]